ncbi:MAG: NF038104 family lipoprotein [Asticcacaulis sp.]
MKHPSLLRRICLFIPLLGLPIMLQGCLAAAATGAVVGTAVGVTGAVVGTTGKVIGAAIPDGDDDENDEKKSKKSKKDKSED